MQKPSGQLIRHGWALLFASWLALAVWLLLPLSGVQAQANSPAFVRIIHASPFVGTADVFVDGNPFLTSFVFGAVTDYAEVPPGNHKVQIALVGKGIAGAALTETLQVQAGGVYTVAAIGTSATNLGLQIFYDDNRAAAGTARLRFYQLSPNGGWIDLLNDGQTMTGVSYQQASPYLTMDSGPNQFQLSSATTSKELSIKAKLQANTVTSIFAVGLYNGTPGIRVVTKQVAAVPGMPQTGSDPRPQASASGSFPLAWPISALALAVLAVSLLAGRNLRKHSPVA